MICFQNELKHFNIKLGQVGKKSCVVVDYGDDDEDDPSWEFFGNPTTCRIRFPDILDDHVKALNIDTKTFNITHQ